MGSRRFGRPERVTICFVCFLPKQLGKRTRVLVKTWKMPKVDARFCDFFYGWTIKNASENAFWSPRNHSKNYSADPLRWPYVAISMDYSTCFSTSKTMRFAKSENFFLSGTVRLQQTEMCIMLICACPLKSWLLVWVVAECMFFASFLHKHP